MTEQNLPAAKALLEEQRIATGNKKQEATVRRKLRLLAAQTPANHEKTVLALDIAATRLGCGTPGIKGLEFAAAR